MEYQTRGAFIKKVKKIFTAGNFTLKGTLLQVFSCEFYEISGANIL